MVLEEPLNLKYGRNDRVLNNRRILNNDKKSPGITRIVSNASQVIQIEVVTDKNQYWIMFDEFYYVYDYVRNVVLQRLTNPHRGRFFCMTYNLDLVMLMTGGRDGNIQIWNTKVFSKTTELHGHANSVISMAVHPSHKLLFSSSVDKTIRIWELTTFTCVRYLTKSEHSFTYRSGLNMHLTEFVLFFCSNTFTSATR